MLGESTVPEMLVRIPPLLFAITVHEFAHAWTAVRLGDPTPRDHGRITLNPIAHLDPMGALLLLFAGFGWGKPVPVNPYNLRHPRRDHILVSVAGVGANLATALVLAAVLRWTLDWAFWTSRPAAVVWNMCHDLCWLSIGLMFFNLLPIPPLDGSHVLRNFLPREAALAFVRATPVLKIVFLVLFFGPMLGLPNVFGQVISWPIIHLVDLLLGPANGLRLL